MSDLWAPDSLRGMYHKTYDIKSSKQGFWSKVIQGDRDAAERETQRNRLGNIICPHCLKSVLFQQLHIECPYCSAEYDISSAVEKKVELLNRLTENPDEKILKANPAGSIGQRIGYSFLAFASLATLMEIIYNNCMTCKGKIRYIECYNCNGDIDTFTPYSFEELERRRCG